MDYKDFQSEVLSRLAVIESKIDDYKQLKSTASSADARSKQNEKDINEINEKIKWISRTISASIIAALIGIIFVYLKMGMGIK